MLDTLVILFGNVAGVFFLGWAFYNMKKMEYKAHERARLEITKAWSE